MLFFLCVCVFLCTPAWFFFLLFKFKLPHKPGPHDRSAADVTPVHRCTCSSCKNKWPIYSSKDQLLQPAWRHLWSASAARCFPNDALQMYLHYSWQAPSSGHFFLSRMTQECVFLFILFSRRLCFPPKSGLQACDLHATCFLQLNFVSVSMTIDKSWIIHMREI